MDSLITKLYRIPKTIFTLNDLALIWGETSRDNLKAKIAYYVKRGAIIRLTRGVFAKTRDFNPKELAAGIYSPSYISFETVLREAGIIFQHYETIFAAGLWQKKVTVGGHSILFRKLKDVVLYNTAGVINDGNYSIATPERALLDTLYLFPDYYFDNLTQINWETCFELVKIYDNKRLIKRLNKLYKTYAK